MTVDSSLDAFNICFCGSEYQLVADGEGLFQENGLHAHESGPSRIVSPSDERAMGEYREVQSPFRSRTPSESSDIQSENESFGP